MSADTATRTRSVFAGKSINVFSRIISGWAVVSTAMNDRFMILNYYCPGEVAPPNSVAHTECIVVSGYEPDGLITMGHQHVWREHKIFRQRMVNFALMEADQSMAHLLCEIVMRTHGHDAKVDRLTLTIPFGQEDLGQMLGISTIHVNRVFRSLRERKLVTYQPKLGIDIHSMKALIKFAAFDANYLR